MYNRPVSLPSATTKVLTAHGSLYVTITNDNGKLVEVFAHLGKAGSCDSAYIAAITRLASIALQYGVPIEVITKQLRAISCHPFMVGSDTENTSPVDAIGHVLEGGYNASSNK